MAKVSTQHKLDRVRPPRVQITYDVETGGAIEIKELPFVVGVLGDFTGQPEQPLPKLKERRFVEVTPDNFLFDIPGHRLEGLIDLDKFESVQCADRSCHRGKAKGLREPLFALAQSGLCLPAGIEIGEGKENAILLGDLDRLAGHDHELQTTSRQGNA